MGKASIVNTLLLVGAVVLAAGTLGVAIAILVNVNNNNSNSNNSNQTTVYTDVASSKLNFPAAKQITAGDDKFTAYKSVVDLFKASVNLSADPCNDFYAYTCGSFNGDMSFDVSDGSNANDMITRLTMDDYIKSAPLPVKQTRWYFDQCVKARQNWDALVADGKVVTDAINNLGAGLSGFQGTQFPFPMLDQKTDVTAFPSGVGLGYLAGALAAQGVDTIVSAGVDTNWKDPAGPEGFAYLIDQPTTFVPNTYYLKNWANTKASLTYTINQTMYQLAGVQKKTLDPTILAKDIADIVQLDYMLAVNFSTDDTTRRQYERSYNPNTLSQLISMYGGSVFSWHTFIPLATGSAENVLMKLLMGNSYNYFIVMEPQMINKLWGALQAGNAYGITPRALVNYFYYRLVDANSEFLPSPKTSSAAVLPIVKMQKQPVGRPRHLEPHERKYQKTQISDVSQAQASCVFETIDQMQFANARVFVDQIYQTPQSRKDIREHVAKIASSIVIGFRSMIDQLNWMSPSTKKGAYNKIENLVKNIAYPDWITDDNQLSAYYAVMNFTQTDSYFSMFFNAQNFNIFAMWDQLAQGAADRTGFNGPPGVTNAWYQPELNSITFPAGILKKPFYDFNWPASVNFGAMGVIAGHELTHGFDDQGVQWNGVGALNGWMDSSSKQDFVSMAKCVVDEYSGFCPLDKAKYGQAACIDGAQTQGENIADNGGIHSAFRAYKNYVDLYGPDPVLPDETFQYFSPDQLFFLSFAQVWCQLPPSDAGILRQLLVDVHSPSIYRVWGTIQNFPAFKTAFNCPASNYAPDKHCNVWVSDIDTTYGLPNSKTDLNIAPEAAITSRDVKKLNAYQRASDYYSNSVNTQIDPCTDFYAYACGNFNQSVSFYTARAQNLIYMSQQLEDPKYQATINNSTALTKEKRLYNACLTATVNSNTEDQILIKNNYIQKKVNTLQGLLGQKFNLLTKDTVNLPSAKQLADAMGYLSFHEGIDTFITPLVDTNWDDNSKGYRMFIDQNSAYLPSKNYYQPAAWKIEQPKYLAIANDVISRYAKEQNIALPDNFQTTLSDVLNYEQMIATTYSTDDDTRRQFLRSWHLVAHKDLGATYTFIDWDAYLGHVPSVASKIVTDPNYQVSVMEQGMMKAFSDDYVAKKLDATKLVNLLYVRLLLTNAQYIPSYASAFAEARDETLLQHLGLSRRRTIPNHVPVGSDIAANGPECANVANDLMQFANGRVFVDYMYPTQADVDAIRASAGGVISNVITSFQGMIDQLDWMTPDTKKLAYDKTVAIQRNIAFPDWIKDNTALDKYYQALDVTDADNYYEICDKLTQFNIALQYNQLNMAATDRSDFLGQPGTVNAWYQPELNSITFPAGILVPPYFDPNWPPSINYGGMGLVAGHELTHGFDDQGVQWGPTGNLKKWMDDNSTKGFTDMATCVINEYNGFCPLDATKYTPNCVKGSQTQGENIADNGGIHAAFNAYRFHQALDGPDPRLPDRLFSQFSHDQLFFMSFAQVWCEVRRTDERLYTQIMVDPHSPSMYRVFGTIQNFPAFQTAFNCPSGSASAPTTHCDVWAPNKYQ